MQHYQPVINLTQKINQENIQINAKKSLNSLKYIPQFIDCNSLHKLNRAQLLELLYQVEDVNQKLKKNNGYQALTMKKLYQKQIKSENDHVQISNNQENNHQLYGNKHETLKQENQNDKQFKKTLIQFNNLMKQTRQRKRKSEEKTSQKIRLKQLQKKLSKIQWDLQNARFQEKQLQKHLSNLQTEINSTQKIIAQKQVRQKYLNKNKRQSPNLNELNDSKQMSQLFNQDDDQVDWILQQMYNKVIGVMGINQKQKF